MSFVDTWRLAFLGGLLSAVCLCSCATGPAGSRPPQEGLLVPFIPGDSGGWEVGHSAADEAHSESPSLYDRGRPSRTGRS